MQWIRYELKTTTDASSRIGELLTEFGVNGYELQDNVPLSAEEERKMYTDIPAELPPDNGEAVLVFYSDVIDGDSDAFYSTGSSLRDAEIEQNVPDRLLTKPEAFIKAFTTRVEKASSFAPITFSELTYQVEDDSAWKDKWKENFKPFRIADDVLIKPTWEPVPEDCSESDIVLSIDPGSAFGTGTHETTKLCLLSLRNYIHDDTRLMDAGCGSGILSVAGLLLGAGSAVGVDIDALAGKTAVANAEINHVGDKFTGICGNLADKVTGTFDVVVANIVADVVILLTKDAPRFMKLDTVYIMSGIIDTREDDVLACLADKFEIIDRKEEKGWVALAAKLK